MLLVTLRSENSLCFCPGCAVPERLHLGPAFPSGYLLAVQNLHFPCLTGRVGCFNLLKVSLAVVVTSRAKQGLWGGLTAFSSEAVPLQSTAHLAGRICAKSSMLVQGSKTRQDKSSVYSYHFSSSSSLFIRHFRLVQDTSKVELIAMPARVPCNQTSPSS